VPLRELIQNAADSVRARQALQEGFRGVVEVRVSPDGREIAVKDDGVGMGVNVLTGALLDFGRSLWESEELSTVLPGLQAVGFRPTGRFGIGFFSVFIWADQVDIVSRARGASAETLVLRRPRQPPGVALGGRGRAAPGLGNDRAAAHARRRG
jgi:HSP90 family molecular chaperone